MAATHSGNQQPWRFIVVDEPTLRDTLGALDTERGPYHVSPHLIIVCADIGSMIWNCIGLPIAVLPSRTRCWLRKLKA